MLLRELSAYQDQQLTLDKLQEVAREKGILMPITSRVQRHFRHYKPLLEWGLNKIDSGSFALGVSVYIREQKLTIGGVLGLDFLPTPLRKELQMFLSI